MERTAELQILTQRLLKVQDEERRKLARDLHDSTGQTLAALKISVSFLLENCEQDVKTLRIVNDVAELADRAFEEIRTMSYLLHPPLLDEIGFACAAEWFIEGFAKRSGIDVTQDLATDDKRLPMNIEIALFRVLQESLTNVLRHSKALRASVCFRRQPNAATLEVRDFGRGIPIDRLVRLREASAEAGVGLAGMRERLNELNGHLEIESDGQGTILRAIVPLLAVTLADRSGEGQEMIQSHTDEVSKSPIGLSLSSE
jgi:signal transduction histidine kinase